MLELSADKPKIIVPLFARDEQQLRAQAAALQAAPDADLAELRLDPLPVNAYAQALTLTKSIVRKPLIVTIRTAREGGEAALSPQQYADVCCLLLLLGGFDALDIEWKTDATLTSRLCAAAKEAGITALFSEHHFDATPATEVMTDTLTGMLDAGADVAKLAVMPHNRADAARLLLATAQAAARRPGAPLITMSMGRDGAATRFCGSAFGSAATFGTLSAASAPGQPPAALLRRKLLCGEDL